MVDTISKKYYIIVMNNAKQEKLLKAGFSIGSAWDAVGLTPEQAKKAEADYQKKIKQNRG
jgi:hypothetical protein